MTPLEYIIDKAVKANLPEDWSEYDLTEASDYINSRVIRLADILLAIGKVGMKTPHFMMGIGEGGFYLYYDEASEECERFWDLQNDNIKDQSPETQLFIAKLLGYKE